jgi:hypothetical protein
LLLGGVDALFFELGDLCRLRFEACLQGFAFEDGSAALAIQLAKLV